MLVTLTLYDRSEHLLLSCLFCTFTKIFPEFTRVIIWANDHIFIWEDSPRYKFTDLVNYYKVNFLVSLTLKPFFIWVANLTKKIWKKIIVGFMKSCFIL